MHIAIKETLLPGETLLQKLQAAQSAGIDGVELSARGLTERVPEVVAALSSSDLRVSAVATGPTRLLHPDYNTRDRAIAEIRQAMADSLDVEASGVVVTPHYSASAVLPDLRPYKSAGELEAELLVKQFRATLCDLAYALGAMLYLHIASRQQVHMVYRVDDGAEVLRRCDDHPHLRLAIDLPAVLAEVSDPDNPVDDAVALLRIHARRVDYVSVAEPGGRIPGAGDTDFTALLGGLKAGGYDGWLTLAMRVPNIADPTYPDELQATVTMLREAWAAAPDTTSEAGA